MHQTLRFSGTKIREARHAAGMTQASLALASGTRERNIIRWENDQHSPRFEHIAAIAKATGKDISFFAAEGSTPDDEDEEPDSHVMMRAAYFLDLSGESSLADDLRLRARRAAHVAASDEAFN